MSALAPALPDVLENVLADHAPVGLLATDGSWRIVAANAAVSRLTGYGEEALLGRSLGSLMTPAGQILYQAKYAAQLLDQGVIDELALQLVRADGQRVSVLLSSRAIADARAPLAEHVTSLTPAEDRRAYERDLLAARRRAEASERYLGELHQVTRDLTAARSPRAVEATLESHLLASGSATLSS